MSETDAVRVLLVDDDADFAALAAEFLEREDDRLEVQIASDATEGMERLRAAEFDCVVSDHDMPGRDGIEFLGAVRERAEDLPFVLFTGKGSEEVASEAISAGVTDYVRKGGTERYGLLANRITNAVARERSRRALEDRNRRLETLIDNLPGVVYRCRNEPGWPMAYVEGECEALTGYSAAALESGEVTYGEDVVHPSDRANLWDEVQSAIEADDAFEVTYRIRTRDGEVKWVWERGRAVGSGAEPDALEGFITDVTDRVERRAELERYETIVEETGDPVYALDPGGRFTFVNDALTEMTGYREDELLGEEASVLLEPASIERGEEMIRSLLSSDEERGTFEMAVRTADGEHLDCEARVGIVRADGEFRGTVGVVRTLSGTA